MTTEVRVLVKYEHCLWPKWAPERIITRRNRIVAELRIDFAAVATRVLRPYHQVEASHRDDK